MPSPEPPVSKRQRVPAGSFEPAGGPNYALPGASQVPPLPLSSRIPPSLLFGTLLVLLLGAGGFLLFSSPPEPEELTAEKIGALIHEQEATVRANAAALSQQRTGSAVLGIDTYPSGATVTMDGSFVGETPVFRDRLPSQWYVLSIRKDGHQPVDSLVYLESGQRAFLSVALTPSGSTEMGTTDERPLLALEQPEARQTEGPRAPIRTSQPRQVPPQAEQQPVAPPPSSSQTGSIRVTSIPDGVPVTLDGRSVGRTPLNLDGVTPGTHTVELTLSGHDAQAFLVDVEAGQQNTVQAAMAAVATPPEPQMGSLSIIVHPWGSIYVDGTLYARDTDLRYEVALPVGEHQVRVEHPSLGAWERTVEIMADQPTSLTADLNPR